MSDSTEVAQLRADPQGLGPGEMLTQAREEHDIPIEEMARRLRLPVTTLRALEECDRGRLPENAYVLGYVRAFARMLDLDPEPYVAAYKSWLGEQTPASGTAGLDTRSGQRQGARRARWILMVLLAAMAAAAGLWWWQKGRLPLLSAPAPAGDRRATVWPDGGEADGPSREAAEAAPVVPSAPREPVSSAPDSEASGGPVEPAAARTPEPAPQAAVAAAGQGIGGAGTGMETGPAAGGRDTASPQGAEPAPAPPPAPSEGHRLVLRFKAQSWTEVYDSEGKRLLFDLYKPGQVKTVEGKPPFRIRLGFADGVELLYDGRPVDVSRYVRQDKTARFTLDPDESTGAEQ